MINPFRHIILVLALTSCGLFGKNEDQGASMSPKMSDVKQRAEVYRGLLGDPYQHVSRCDSLTFVGHLAAGVPRIVDIYKHEYDGGIHRSITPCNTNPGAEGPKMDSRSECSKENILAWFHAMLSLKDTDAILRTIRNARADDWRFCRGGDDTYNRAREFAPLLNDWEKKLSRSLSLAEESDAIAIPNLEGFRGNVLASYVLLKGRAFGYIRDVELEAVRTLIATVPESPLYRAIYSRFTDGKQSKAIRIMTTDDWPVDRLPDGKAGQPNAFQWEGSHPAMLYIWTFAVMNGT